MIEFIQDYTTKALPPEVFEDGQQVTRSPESELYFVRLGVAGYVHEGNLVDQDFQPISRTQTVIAIDAGDRRFGATIIGVDAPQRASSGPVVDLFGATELTKGLSQVEVDQLTSDLAASMQQLDDHRATTSTQIDELTTNLTAVQGARETALSDLAAALSERDAAIAQRDAAISERDAAYAARASAESEVVRLQALLDAAAATSGSSTDGAGQGDTDTATTTKRGK